MNENIETRLSNAFEVPRLKEIWRLAFGDEEAYIDGFFRAYYRPERVMTLHAGGVLVSSIYMFPMEALVFPDGGRLSCSCTYALGTDPKYRGHDYGMKCMDASLKYLASTGYDCNVQVPAGDSLFVQYNKRIGYSDGFYVREAALSASDIGRGAAGVGLAAVNPVKYNNIRNRFLGGTAHIAFDTAGIRYQNALCRDAGGGLYEMRRGRISGCMTVEKLEDSSVFIKELLVPDELLPDALAEAAALFPAESYIVRTPAGRGAPLGGTVRRFAMVKFFGRQAGTALTAEMSGYFGLAFD